MAQSRRRIPALSEEQRAAVRQHLEQRTRTAAELAEEFDVSRATVYTLLPLSRRRGQRLKNLDLTGRQFGSWTVLNRCSPPRECDRHTFWECRCECGEVSKVRASYLVNGRSSKCVGCRNRSLGARRKKEKEENG